MTDAHSIVRDYLSAWDRKDTAAISALMSDSVTFKGPMAQSEGREGFIAGVKAMFPMLERIDVREILTSGEKAVAVYDFVCRPPIGVCRTCELVHVSNDRISSSEIFFDARPFEKLAQRHSARQDEMA